jgi:hypothetical protein
MEADERMGRTLVDLSRSVAEGNLTQLAAFIVSDL